MPTTAKPHPALAAKSTDGQHKLADLLAEENAGYIINAEHLLLNLTNPSSVVIKLLPEAANQKTIKPRLVIQHTNGGPHSSDLQALFGFRSQPGIDIEAHLQVQLDGVIGQFMPFNRVADANFHANRFIHNGVAFGAISHETQDHGFKHLELAKDPWTMEQLAAIIGATTAECVVYNIRCNQPAEWNDSGIGHHSLFPFLGEGVLGAWSKFQGKVCPGKARIAQMDFLRSQVAQRMAKFYVRSGGRCP